MSDTKKKIEKRYLMGVELREATDSKPVIAGHAAVFDSPWDQRMTEWFGFEERIKPGSFAEDLKAADCDFRALFNHDSNYILGRYSKPKNKDSARAYEDTIGLMTECYPPATREAETVLTYLRDGLVDAMSFAFEVLGEEWVRDGDIWTRWLTRVRISDISVVTYPAYPATDAGVRSLFGVVPDIASPDVQRMIAQHTTVPLAVLQKRLRLRELTRRSAAS